MVLEAGGVADMVTAQAQHLVAHATEGAPGVSAAQTDQFHV